MKKKFLFGLCLVAIGFIIFLIINAIINRDNTLISNPKTIKNIVFTNGKIRKEDKIYTFTVNISSTEDTKIDHVDAVLVDKNDNIIEILEGEVGDLKSNEKKTLEMTTEKDLKNAYSVNYTIYE